MIVLSAKVSLTNLSAAYCEQAYKLLWQNDWQIYRLADRHTDRSTDRQAGRQTDRQTDRHTHAHRHLHTRSSCLRSTSMYSGKEVQKKPLTILTYRSKTCSPARAAKRCWQLCVLSLGCSVVIFVVAVQGSHLDVCLLTEDCHHYPLHWLTYPLHGPVTSHHGAMFSGRHWSHFSHPNCWWAPYPCNQVRVSHSRAHSPVGYLARIVC